MPKDIKNPYHLGAEGIFQLASEACAMAPYRMRLTASNKLKFPLDKIDSPVRIRTYNLYADKSRPEAIVAVPTGIVLSAGSCPGELERLT